MEVITKDATSIKCYVTKIDSPISEQYKNKLLSFVSRSEQKRILSYKGWKDQQARLIACLILKKEIHRLFGYQLENIHFVRTSYGKPKIKDLDWNGDFSISYSEDWIICTIVNVGNVGVDIEKIRNINLKEINKYLSACSNIKFNSGDKLEKFFYWWAIIESFLKARGYGFSHPLSSMINNIKLYSNNGKLCIVDDDQNWHLRQINIDKNYQIVLCWSHPIPTVNPIYISIENLLN